MKKSKGSMKTKLFIAITIIAIIILAFTACPAEQKYRNGTAKG